MEKVLHGHLPAADARTGIVVLRIDPTARRPARQARAATCSPPSPSSTCRRSRSTACPHGHPLLAGAIALQLLTLELVLAAGTNPDLIRREEDAVPAPPRRPRARERRPAALLASLLWGTADFLGGPREPHAPGRDGRARRPGVGLVALALVLLFRGVDAGAFVPGALAGAVRRRSRSSPSTARSRSGR